MSNERPRQETYTQPHINSSQIFIMLVKRSVLSLDSQIVRSQEARVGHKHSSATGLCNITQFKTSQQFALKTFVVQKRTFHMSCEHK